MRCRGPWRSPMDPTAMAAGFDRPSVAAADRPVQPVYPTAEPAARDRVRRRISPAPGPASAPEGWVANRAEKPSRGLSRQSSMTAEVAPGISPRFSILRSAEIMASGFLVSSTDPASASSSRDRDSARRTSCDNIQATAIRATATMMTMTAPPPEPFRLSEDEEDDDEDDDEDD